HEERIGDQLSVTAPGHRFGAEDGGGSLSSELEQPVERGVELVRAHVVGVGAEGGALPGDVARVALTRGSPTQGGKPGVGETGGGERVAQCLAGEVWMPA